MHVDPVFNLYNQRWPIYSASFNAPPAKFVFEDEKKGRVGTAVDSLASEGVIVSGGLARRCILSPYVRINSYAEVDDSILLEGVTIGRHCKIKKSIIDKNVDIPPKTRIGFDAEEDRARGFTVTEGGITVVPKGMKIK